MLAGTVRWEDPDRERGSMVVAVAIILVMGLLGSVIATRAVGAALLSSSHQSVASAVSEADAGLADALYRIDQGTSGTGTGTAFCVGGSDPNCLAASVPAAPGVSYLATQVSDTDWLVRSLATVAGKSAAVEGHVTRQAQYPFALFGNTSLNFNGDSTQSFSSYSPASPAGSSPANPDPGGAVMVGSNGSITCNGGLGSNVTVEYYGTGGVGSTGTSDCGSYKKSPDRYYVYTPTAPAGALPCPGTGTSGSELGSGFAGAPTDLVAGTYVCNTPITISGLLDVSGPVQLYVILGSTYGAGTAAITIAPGSYVNDQADYCANGGTTGCDTPSDLPASQDLQIFSDTTGTIGNDTGSGYYLGAVLYAPNASLTQDGCQSNYYGSLVLNTLTCEGGPHLDVSYDSSLASLYGPWASSGYTQIDPADFQSAMSASGL